MNLGQIARIVSEAGHRAPTAAKVAGRALEARSGNAEAQGYLISEGWADALDVLHPGLGGAGKLLLENGMRSLEIFQSQMAGNIVEGSATRDDPTARAVQTWLARRRYGPVVIVGNIGSGKTMTALRLAQVQSQTIHVPVSGVALYGEDRPRWCRPLAMSTLIERMEWLAGRVDTDGEDAYAEIHPSWAGQIVVVDESGLVVKPKKARRKAPVRLHLVDDEPVPETEPAPSTFTARDAVITLLNQCRHIDTVAIFVGQLFKQVPAEVVGRSTVIIKRPSGDEQDVDRQEPLFRHLWLEAQDAFRTVRQHPWWPDYPDERAWSYVRAPEYNNGKGYRGLIPFGLPKEHAA